MCCPASRATGTPSGAPGKLHDVFAQVDLTASDFRNRSFTRLEQLQYLIRTEQIDDRFFWVG